MSLFYSFNQSKLLLDQSKLQLKFWFESTWLNRYLIDAQLIESIFRSIEAQFLSIEFRKLSVLKKGFLTCSSLFSKNFKHSLSLFLFDRSNLRLFVVFFHKSLQGFCPQALVSLLYPFPFPFNHMFHAFSCIYLKNSNIGF